MSSLSNVCSSPHSKAGFWKRNISVPGSIKPVYGAEYPPAVTHRMPSTLPRESKPKTRKQDPFYDFENKTSDAWDDGDDDFIRMASVRLSLKDIHSSAETVLENHGRLYSKHARNIEHGSSQSHCFQNTHEGFAPMLKHCCHPGGPGLGMRLNRSLQPPKMEPVQYGSSVSIDRHSAKLEKFTASLAEPRLNIDDLRNLSWSGIPKVVRPTVWKILSGYVPPAAGRRQATLDRKRKEYFSFVEQYYETRHHAIHEETFRQIHIDIPRMSPLISIFQQKIVQEILRDIPRMTSLAHLFQQKSVQEIFERILYIWAIRHPASGYVQGINDLVTPFFVVFLSEHMEDGIEPDDFDLLQLPAATRAVIEADSFWCTSRLLDGIQDNYTFAQPGIQMTVKTLSELIKRVDAPLHRHLEHLSVEFLQFSFRWMNNLLMREIPLHCTIHLWDTYQSEINGFAEFHLYVCAAFLKRFSADILRQQDFQGVLMLLQNLPTHHWGDVEIRELLAEAFELKYLFADAPKHLELRS